MPAKPANRNSQLVTERLDRMAEWVRRFQTVNVGPFAGPSTE